MGKAMNVMSLALQKQPQEGPELGSVRTLHRIYSLCSVTSTATENGSGLLIMYVKETRDQKSIKIELSSLCFI